MKSHRNYAQGFKQQQISGGSTIYTDCFRAYLCLEEAGYHHEAVNQSADEWVRGEAYTNSCENRAFLFKHWLAIHRGICKDNLSLYLAAFKACRKSRGMEPVEVIKEILEVVFIFIAFLAILIAVSALKQPQEASHNIFIYELRPLI